MARRLQLLLKIGAIEVSKWYPLEDIICSSDTFNFSAICSAPLKLFLPCPANKTFSFGK